MKHPDRNIETFEFNLGKAPTLRCVHSIKTTAFCGSCEACLLTKQVTTTKAWFLRAGDQSQQRFALGLIRRLQSVDLIQYVINLLQPLLYKDFTYARTRTTPSLATDRATMSSDRALSVVELEKYIAETWFWFQEANYWTKSNYLLTFLQICEAHLLHIIGTQARTLLVSEQKAFIQKDDYESGSIASSANCSYRSQDHPELELLSTVGSQYSVIKQNPFSVIKGKPSSRQSTVSAQSKKASFQPHSQYDESEIINDDSEDDWFGDSMDSLDPTCLVLPGSAKAYAGVSKYRDFIRSLPVHLSKYIMGFLDRVSLFNCVCVSRHWRMISEEVHREFYVNQQVREEVMLMQSEAQGASAQGCNPVYAKDIDVAVPNITRGSWEAIKTGDGVIETTFKSEVSFSTAFSGYSTRRIIMEERNVYCGAYNVMVLTDLADPSRVVDSDGSNLIAVGSLDRKVCFLNSETGQEEPPVVSGHAGSVRCVAVCKKQGYVLSGSYDTSIRKWSLLTGKCEKIFRGHRDTVQCLKICGDKIVSGAKDHMCKVWLLETGKCIRTFKHRHAVTAVAMADDPLPEIVVSGCEGGRVKVWDMKIGKIIKRLSGHHSPVTDIKFDSWHIVTASRDGYALVWSSQGNHSRCLSALRHPKEVLCLEFMYLRVITGSADGKLRIWNIINGQCLRIMRGNSRSDPIMQLTAIGHTITINTSHNLLVLNFESVEYDYSLENDKMPPLVQYSKYSDAPVRRQPYPYVRAQRMKTAGATNQKIINHDGGRPNSSVHFRNVRQSGQTPHSAKSLSKQSLDKAKRIQSAGARLERTKSAMSMTVSSKNRSAVSTSNTTRASTAVSMRTEKPAGNTKSASALVSPNTPGQKPTSAKSVRTVISGKGDQIAKPDTDSDVTDVDTAELRRRVSWAFENPLVPHGKDMSLPDTKSLLRSHMRAKGEVIPPDFIYLAVNTIHANTKPTEASKNMESNRREQELQQARKLGRPASSPGRVDPRTKVPVEDLGLEQFWVDDYLVLNDTDNMSEIGSRVSCDSKASKAKAASDDPLPPSTTVIIREFGPKPIDTKPNLSLHSAKVKSSIPKARLLRPHTATVVQGQSLANTTSLAKARPKSAAVVRTRPGTAQTSTSAGRSSNLETGVKKSASLTGLTTSAAGPSHVPMMMFSKDMKNKLDTLREHRAIQQAEIHDSIVNARVGNVSKYNNPMRTHANFRLLTHEQVEARRTEILNSYQEGDRLRRESKEKRQREAWLAKVKGVSDKDYTRKPVHLAPEIKEYTQVNSVC